MYENEQDVAIEAERDNGSPAALVIGGGIAGMQAALDIADAGFKVYLVEREPSIGGRMAQLDKTFPTLDCSACIMTPKMVDVSRNANIELMTYSEVVGVQGQKGRFRATVRNKPRYVDIVKCTGCADCVKNCPVEVDSEFDQGLVKRKAVYRPFPQAVPNAFVIDKKETPPCKMACPVYMDVQGYIALIREGKLGEAYRLIRRTNPLPAVCGLVCYHPCEEECKRNHLDDALAIRALKRFACEQFDINELEIPEIEKNGRQVAIIGSGPAGLTAAHDLAVMGYEATIFEALPEPGGMLRVGIPEYRLPAAILQDEIGYIERLGVDIKTNTRIGKEITLDDLRRDYEAVFIATGAHESRKLGVPGEDAEGVIHGVDFLRRVNLGAVSPVGPNYREKVEAAEAVGDRVAVIGGGNTAVDAARVARRLGARDVSILYRRSRAEMPALAEEVEGAETEGIGLTFLVTPTRVLTEDGMVSGLELIRMELGEPDASGRPRPISIEGSEFTIAVDSVIPALGQVSNLGFAKGLGLELSRRGRLVVDEDTLATNVQGVFAGGDVVTGPWIAIQAMANGRRAARAMDQYLRGQPMHVGEFEVLLPPEELTEEEIELLREERGIKHRLPVSELEPGERIRDFREVELPFTLEAAIEEAARCLECGICSECRECVKLCERGAIDHDQKEEIVELEVAAIVVATGYDQFDARIKPELGYGQYPNVITGLEFERLSSASGPTTGNISLNGKEPKDVVFIQCVGSRDQTVGNEYCSRVCCMYTAKQAHLVRDKMPKANVTIFYIDVRAFGKGFEEFYDRVKREGVMYRRGSVSEIYKRGDRVVVRAEDTILGEPLEMEADLVVLATGVVPRADVGDVAGLLNLERSPDGFFAEAHPKMRPVDTTRDGIYLAGCCQGPKDIPDTVAQAKAAASSVIVILRQQSTQYQISNIQSQES